MRLFMILILAFLMLTNSCTSRPPSTTKNLTTRQRDSTLAQEKLPGATVVGRALDISDGMDARNAALAAQVDSLPR